MNERANLWTRVKVTGPGDKLFEFNHQVIGKLKLDLDCSQIPDEGIPEELVYLVEVTQLQWAIRTARECGCQARETVTEGWPS